MMLLVSGISFISCLLCFFIGIKQKKLVFVLIAILMFITTLFCSLALVFKTSKLFYSKTKSKINQNLKPRSGIEIYNDLFGKSSYNCVNILQFKDQIVPTIDVSICLEFESCPMEIKRLLSLNNYKIQLVQTTDTTTINYVSDQPYWFNVKTMGNTFFEAIFVDEQHPGQSKILCFNKDSSRVFYCDIGD